MSNGIESDPGSTVKGHAVDKAAEPPKEKGVENGTANPGGNAKAPGKEHNAGTTKFPLDETPSIAKTKNPLVAISGTH